MKKNLLTIDQVQKKYKGKYVMINRILDWESGDVRIEVLKTSNIMRENMCLGEDVGTNMAYRR